MDIEKPKVQQVDSDGEGTSSPPHKKTRNPTFDPLKELIGKSQTFLNSNFVFYYKNVGLFNTEEEWEEFSEALYRELPTTFRITSTTSSSDIVHAFMQELFCSDTTGVYELGGKVVIDKPTPLPWYPKELAYHFAASRKSLRLSPLTKHLKHFLTHETEIGNINRQEAVSMVPPLLLDVQSHHKILDMCAAPGSKTCQLVEMLHASCPANQTPTGFVMANDVNIARCYLLAHQVHRLGSPAVLVSHYDATQFPFIQLSSTASENDDSDKKETLQFDRILCDVPCSGDGTIRKNATSGSTWDFFTHFKLFKLQLSIAQRSAQLLKVGGRMVYSTCAFNPIEDEAVVAQLLRESNGALRLIETSDMLPKLIRKPGVHTWKVIDSKTKVYTNKEEVPEASRARIPEAVFPPTESELAEMHLERCMRFFPHLQDTGGFFVAVLEKVGETNFCSSETVAPPSVTELGLDDAKEPKAERGFSEDPFWAVPEVIEHDLKKGLSEYYGVEDVNCDAFSHLLIRSPVDPNASASSSSESEFGNPAAKARVEDVNMIYRVSAPVHELLRRSKGQRFVSAGIRFVENFAKKNKHLTLDCGWRITAEGLSGISHLLRRHVVQIGLEDFKTLLRLEKPKFEEFTEKLRKHLEQVAVAGVGVVAINVIPSLDYEDLTSEQKEEKLSQMSKRERLIHTTNQWVMGWLGFTSFTLAIRKLELKSWKNLYLTNDYSFEFDPTVVIVNEEEKAELIRQGREKKAQRDAERKRDVKEQKAARRAGRPKKGENSDNNKDTNTDEKPVAEQEKKEEMTEKK